MPSKLMRDAAAFRNRPRGLSLSQATRPTSPTLVEAAGDMLMGGIENVGNLASSIGRLGMGQFSGHSWESAGDLMRVYTAPGSYSRSRHLFANDMRRWLGSNANTWLGNKAVGFYSQVAPNILGSLALMAATAPAAAFGSGPAGASSVLSAARTVPASIWRFGGLPAAGLSRLGAANWVTAPMRFAGGMAASVPYYESLWPALKAYMGDSRSSQSDPLYTTITWPYIRALLSRLNLLQPESLAQDRAMRKISSAINYADKLAFSPSASPAPKPPATPNPSVSPAPPPPPPRPTPPPTSSPPPQNAQPSSQPATSSPSQPPAQPPAQPAPLSSPQPASQPPAQPAPLSSPQPASQPPAQPAPSSEFAGLSPSRDRFWDRNVVGFEPARSVSDGEITDQLMPVPYAGWTAEDRKWLNAAQNELDSIVSSQDSDALAKWRAKWSSKIQKRFQKLFDDWAARMSDHTGVRGRDFDTFKDNIRAKIEADGWDLRDLEQASTGFVELLSTDPGHYAQLLGKPELAPMFANIQAQNQDLLSMAERNPTGVKAVILTDPAKFQSLTDWFSAQDWWVKALLSAGAGVGGIGLLNAASGGNGAASVAAMLGGLGLAGAGAYSGGLFSPGVLSPKNLGTVYTSDSSTVPTQFRDLSQVKPLIDELLSGNPSPQTQEYFDYLSRTGQLDEMLAYLGQAGGYEDMYRRLQDAVNNDLANKQYLLPIRDSFDRMEQRGGPANINTSRLIGDTGQPDVPLNNEVGADLLSKAFSGNPNDIAQHGPALDRVLATPIGENLFESYVVGLIQRARNGDASAVTALKNMKKTLLVDLDDKSFFSWLPPFSRRATAMEQDRILNGLPLSAYRRMRAPFMRLLPYVDSITGDRGGTGGGASDGVGGGSSGYPRVGASGAW